MNSLTNEPAAGGRPEDAREYSRVGWASGATTTHEAHDCGMPGTAAMSGGPAAFRALRRQALGGSEGLSFMR